MRKFTFSHRSTGHCLLRISPARGPPEKKGKKRWLFAEKSDLPPKMGEKNGFGKK